jgi:Fe-S-cluster containining protein
MRCSHCGLCCEKTEMLLSSADVKRLERLACRQEFARSGKHGYVRLKNRRGFCVFYDVEKCRCTIYGHRPLGCRIYPVIFSEFEGVVVDDLCPMKDTISRSELKRKGKEVMQLLRRIDSEAASHRKRK